VRRAGDDPDELEREFHDDRERPFPPEIPFVSIFTRLDGVLAPEVCLDPGAYPIEVRTTHRGLRASVPSFQAIAEALWRITTGAGGGAT
jgi:hypothetical protein